MPADAEARAHLDTCPACAALAKSAGPLREALKSSDANAIGVDVDALFESVKSRIASEDKHMTGYLKSRPTWMRVLLAFIAVVLVVTPVMAFVPRPDMADYPRGRMVLTVLSMLLSLGVTLSIALRPAYRPPISRMVITGVSIASLGLLFLFSSIPLPDSGRAEQALMELLPHAMPCFFYGLGFGAPVYFLMRALDHEVTRLAALLAASSAGLTANLALHLHCPNTQPGHILLAHFSVAVVFLALVAMIAALRQRAHDQTDRGKRA